MIAEKHWKVEIEMVKKKAAAEKKEPTFEEAMSRLEEIVRELEESELPLEKSLVIFEEGVGLSRLLNRKLNEAEEKVEILLRDEKGQKVARPFFPEDDSAEDAGEDEGEKEGGDGGQGGLPF